MTKALKAFKESVDFTQRIFEKIGLDFETNVSGYYYEEGNPNDGYNRIIGESLKYLPIDLDGKTGEIRVLFLSVGEELELVYRFRGGVI